jgi:hypothetical protein
MAPEKSVMVDAQALAFSENVPEEKIAEVKPLLKEFFIKAKNKRLYLTLYTFKNDYLGR